MQFLYSSGPQALCAALNQPGWLSRGPSTSRGKQETTAAFKDGEREQVKNSHPISRNEVKITELGANVGQEQVCRVPKVWDFKV